jgi:hypothetical protein
MEDNHTETTDEPTFKAVSAERYMEMEEIVPPIAWTFGGFLIGEPASHRICRVTGQHRPTYTAMVERGSEHFESMTSLTVREWRALDLGTIMVERGSRS